MIRHLRAFTYFLAFLFLLTSCRKKEWDQYYGRPSSLAPPIYQQLKSMGNFTHLLAAIDKSGYKETLSKGGYWTMFAPNDTAFEKFFQENGIKGDNGLDSATARKIIRYALVYNAYREAQLPDYQTSGGPDTSMAFKRKTAYYDWVFAENGKKIIADNANGTYDDNDNNNKYIPYFLNPFMGANYLSASDYTFFYPGSQFSGFNVAGANVIKADIPAENGIIDETNKVILPLPSLEEYLDANPDYSEFRRLLDKMVTYQSDAAVTQRYQALTGSTDSVYVKLYNASLAFSPDNENFLNPGGTDAQAQGWSLVVPDNEALIPYEKEILKYYGTFDAAPPDVLLDLLNSCMWQSNLWPSKLPRTENFEGEVPTFNISNVIDKKICSNGFFYGINTVQQANVFRTVYSKAFLNPAYSLMTLALGQSQIEFSILNPNVHYTMFMISNKEFQAGGYDYDYNRSSWSYLANGGTIQYDPTAQQRVYRILETSVFITPDGEMDDLSGEGIAEAWNGEYIRYKDNTVWASGNVDNGTVVHIDSSATTINGKVYYTDGLLLFSENTIGSRIEGLAQSDPNDFGSFFNYLKHTTLWNADTKTILGLTPGNFYTFFIPTNAAISQAVKDGWLPGDTLTGTPNFKPKDLNDQQQVIQFIQYHILDKNTVVSDGKKSGQYATLYQTLNGDLTFITVDNHLNDMSLTDEAGDTAEVIIPESNKLANRAVIHSINKVLKW